MIYGGYHWLALCLVFVLFFPLIVYSAEHTDYKLYDFIHSFSNMEVVDYLPLMHTLRSRKKSVMYVCLGQEILLTFPEWPTAENRNCSSQAPL